VERPQSRSRNDVWPDAEETSATLAEDERTSFLCARHARIRLMGTRAGSLR